MTDVTMRQLLEVGVHFGHQTRFWCPKMGPYIYGHRNKIHIINLEQTLMMFNDAMNYLSAVASKRGSIMFVGTKSQAGEIVREQAQRAESPYVYHRWLGGMLTNYSTVRQSIDRLKALEETIQSEGFGNLSKKEGLGVEREHFRLNRNLAGIRDMKGLPEALFVIDVKHENIAVKEANKLGIPVVAVVDTNCDPEGIDYVIPGNDDSISAIRLYCTYAAEAILAGRASAQNTSNIQEFGVLADSDSMVNAGVTAAKAAVAPEEDDDTDESEGAVPEISVADATTTVAEATAQASDADAKQSEQTESEEQPADIGAESDEQNAKAAEEGESADQSKSGES